MQLGANAERPLAADADMYPEAIGFAWLDELRQHLLALALGHQADVDVAEVLVRVALEVNGPPPVNVLQGQPTQRDVGAARVMDAEVDDEAPSSFRMHQHVTDPQFPRRRCPHTSRIFVPGACRDGG